MTEPHAKPDTAIGIDIGGTFIKAGLVDTDGNIIYFNKFETPSGKPSAILDVIITAINSIVNDYSGQYNIEGAGLGFPGIVNPIEGTVKYPPNLPSWHHENVVEKFASEFNFPVYIDNDANVMGIAESTWGAGKEHRFIICLTLGTGVGGAIIIDKQVYHGANGGAGELGHITINPRGPLCACGNRGCLESYIGGKYIVRRTLSYLKRFPDSYLHELYIRDKNLVTPKEISRAAEMGDILGLEILSEVAFFLGIGIANFINIFNPEMIIIGGGISNWGKPLLSRARITARKYGMKGLCEGVRIVQAKFKNQAGVIGGACLVFNNKNRNTSLKK
ncbi:ROK family protein [bacterium]|nr:ROK family protein [bacterium]